MKFCANGKTYDWPLIDDYYPGPEMKVNPADIFVMIWSEGEMNQFLIVRNGTNGVKQLYDFLEVYFKQNELDYTLVYLQAYPSGSLCN